MTTIQKRKQVAEFVAKKADDQFISMAFALMQGYISGYDTAYDLSEAEMDELDKEYEDLKTGKVKGFTFEEVKKMAKKKARK